MSVLRFLLSHGECIIDERDGERVHGHSWHSIRNGDRIYVTTSVSGKTIYLHRFVLDLDGAGHGGGDVDHINMNGLDNRRANLRHVSRSLNMANSRSRAGTSRYKGVSWSRACRKWQAHIMVDGKSMYLGLFAEEAAAAHAYDRAALDAWGESARPNMAS